MLAEVWFAGIKINPEIPETQTELNSKQFITGASQPQVN